MSPGSAVPRALEDTAVDYSLLTLLCLIGFTTGLAGGFLGALLFDFWRNGTG